MLHIDLLEYVGVGDKAVNAESRATLCVMKNLRIGERARYAHRERDRHKESTIFKKATVTNDNNNNNNNNNLF